MYICTMQNGNNKIRDEWRKLNLQIANHQKVIKQNSIAGQVFSTEYLNWLNDLIAYRDSLTNKIGA